MSLYRLPFLVAAIWGTHVSYTSPAPPIKEGEHVNEGITHLKPSRFVPISKAIFWAFALLEFIAILSPWLPIPDQNLYLTPVSALAALLSALGGLIRLDCYARMGPQFTFDLSIRKDHRLVTEGPYAYVRHPGYTSAMMAVFGSLVFYTASGGCIWESGVLGWWAVAVAGLLVTAPAWVLRKRMRVEDEALKSRFGREWEVYSARVRWWLVPGVY